MTTSASTRAEQDRRRPGARGTRREKRFSGSLSGDRLAADKVPRVDVRLRALDERIDVVIDLAAELG